MVYYVFITPPITSFPELSNSDNSIYTWLVPGVFYVIIIIAIVAILRNTKLNIKGFLEILLLIFTVGVLLLPFAPLIMESSNYVFALIVHFNPI